MSRGWRGCRRRGEKTRRRGSGAQHALGFCLGRGKLVLQPLAVCLGLLQRQLQVGRGGVLLARPNTQVFACFLHLGGKSMAVFCVVGTGVRQLFHRFPQLLDRGTHHTKPSEDVSLHARGWHHQARRELGARAHMITPSRTSTSLVASRRSLRANRSDDSDCLSRRCRPSTSLSAAANCSNQARQRPHTSAHERQQTRRHYPPHNHSTIHTLWRSSSTVCSVSRSCSATSSARRAWRCR